MNHDVRVLCLGSDAVAVAELAQVDVEDAGVRLMLPKMEHYVIKLSRIRRPIAHILKETLLSQGGDAAVNKDVITARVDFTDVILMGTRKQFQRVLPVLLEQGFGCDRVAAEIEAAIRHYRSPAAGPSSDAAIPGPLARTFGMVGKRTLEIGRAHV